MIHDRATRASLELARAAFRRPGRDFSGALAEAPSPIFGRALPIFGERPEADPAPGAFFPEASPGL